MTNPHDPVREAAQALVNAWPTGYSRTTHEAFAALEAALASSPAVAAEAGDWVMAPREPTQAMLERAMKDCGSIGGGSCGEHTGVDWDDMRCVWNAMIQAAPPAPSGVKVAEEKQS